MALDREIESVRKSEGDWRMLMGNLLRTAGIDRLTDWELDFLEGNLARKRTELSFRQGEILLEIRDDNDFVATTDRGFSVKLLIKNCYIFRFALDDDEDDRDRLWLEDLWASGTENVRRKDARRLVRIARRVGELDPD